jgi:hypothetical protein
MLGHHLTSENHQTVLARARGRSRSEIAALIAELAPRPDVPASIRRLPAPKAEAVVPAPSLSTIETPPASAPPPTPAAPRPVVQPTAPERYRIQLTVGQETHDTLRRLQDLLRREVPDGDAAVIVDRALKLLLETTEKAKFAQTPRPRPARRFSWGG